MITATINGTAVASWISPRSLSVVQQLTNEPDTARFKIIKKTGRTIPAFNDDVVIKDGSTTIFAGKVASVSEEMAGAFVPVVEVRCVDHTMQFDRVLAAKTYESQTITAIISDLVATAHGTAFGTAFASSSFVVEKIVFNQVPPSQCMKRLADIVRYDWYIDENKQVHFFPKFTNSAPFGLTDTDGNHVYTSLSRAADGSQVVNRVKVRGGEYDGTVFTDIITVSGTPLSFVLPYKFADLTVETDQAAGTFTSRTVGIEFIDSFSTDDVLYNFQTQSIRIGTPLGTGAVPTRLRFSGKPKVPVLAIAEDTASVVRYGAIEKLIRDDSIESNTTARRRAEAELLAFAEEVVDARFITYEAGLRTGMVLSVASTNRGFDDDLLIKKITFQARTNDTYEYRVECVSTQRYTLIDLLRKIITPDPRPEDEKETSEQIYAVNEEVVGVDLWTNVAASVMTGTVTAADTWITIDAATIIWVYGYFAPTSHSDPDRMGKYDRETVYQ